MFSANRASTTSESCALVEFVRVERQDEDAMTMQNRLRVPPREIVVTRGEGQSERNVEKQREAKRRNLYERSKTNGWVSLWNEIYVIREKAN